LQTRRVDLIPIDVATAGWEHDRLDAQKWAGNTVFVP
jgi:hypothetical protein